jgi:hypothetical protein
MTQAVIRRHLTSEARVQALVSSCGICGGQSGAGAGYSPRACVLPCHCHSILGLQAHTSSRGGMNNRPVGGRNQ